MNLSFHNIHTQNNTYFENESIEIEEVDPGKMSDSRFEEITGIKTPSVYAPSFALAISKIFKVQTKIVIIRRNGAFLGTSHYSIVPGLFGSHRVFFYKTVYSNFIYSHSKEDEILSLTSLFKKYFANSGSFLCSTIHVLNQSVGINSDFSFFQFNFSKYNNNDDDLINCFQKRKKSYLRKALKMPFVSEIHRKDGIRDFYVLYTKNQKELGSPPCSEIYFHKFLESVASSKIVLIKMNDIPVAGALIFQSQKNETFCPFIATPRSELQSLPALRLYYEVIKLSMRNGSDILNLGRSQKHSGHAHFKSQCGFIEIPVYYYLSNQLNPIAFNPSNRLMFQIASFIWKKLPLKLTIYLGPILQRFL